MHPRTHTRTDTHRRKYREPATSLSTTPSIITPGREHLITYEPVPWPKPVSSCTKRCEQYSYCFQYVLSCDFINTSSTLRATFCWTQRNTILTNTLYTWWRFSVKIEHLKTSRPATVLIFSSKQMVWHWKYVSTTGIWDTNTCVLEAKMKKKADEDVDKITEIVAHWPPVCLSPVR